MSNRRKLTLALHICHGLGYNVGIIPANARNARLFSQTIGHRQLAIGH
ncbi:MAG: hypothetical protein GXP38_10670 [Chloroflexi bacterium]|nr:hypothetical protein [Chloroflexota bacterium]